MSAVLSDFATNSYFALRRYVPARLLYDPQYFEVVRLLSLPPVDMNRHRRERLRYILSVCLEAVPFYKSVNLTPEQVRTEDPFELLKEFPFLDKSTVMANQEEFVNTRLNRRTLHYATSGGSSGQGIGLWRSKRTSDVERAFFDHEWGKFGFSFARSRYLRIGADARRKAHEAPTRVQGNRLMISPYHISEKWRQDILDAINAFRPSYIHGYPSSISALSELIAGQADRHAMKAILLASEPATTRQLATIHRTFGCPISINYGLTERTNIAFATYDGRVSSPYRFEPVYGITEIRNDAGRHEIVGTSLWNDVMPLVRYRTGDFAQVDAAGVCEKIEGRDQEYLIDRFGNHIPGLSIVIDEKTWDFVRYYQVRQSTPGEICIVVVPRQGVLSEADRRFLLDKQTERWGSFFDIRIETAEDIALTSSGKRRLVVRDRPER